MQGLLMPIHHPITFNDCLWSAGTTGTPTPLHWASFGNQSGRGGRKEGEEITSTCIEDIRTRKKMVLFCGLVNVGTKEAVPLQGIWVDVQVKGFVADVSATLKYKNKEEKAVEAIFVFPMDEDSSVYSFEATIEGKKIIADLQEKEQACKVYEEALDRGEQAFLLEEDEGSTDIFSCMVGNLPPGQEAEVTMKYVRELPVDPDGAVRFVLPAILNPRFTPEGHDISVTTTLPQVPVGGIPYTLSLSALFWSSYGVCKIESNCEITPLEYTDDERTGAKVSLLEGQMFERDVELLAYYGEVNKPSVTVEAGRRDTAAGSFMTTSIAMLNFYPCLPAIQDQTGFGEFIFLVDRSESMSLPISMDPESPLRIESAMETLVLLLKSLPLGCYFNVYGFGSRFASFFPESVEYTQHNMEEALKKVQEIHADFGGTYILEPLKEIYRIAGRPEHPRQLFIFTDGEVENTDEVIKLVRHNSYNHRCFSFGIGEGASTSLILGMARAGNGTSQFITGEDRMQTKVLQALKCALQPVVKNISLKWTLPPGVESLLLSKLPTAIFLNQRSIIYAQLQGEADKNMDFEVCLEYELKGEVFRNILRSSLQCEETERPTIHRLAAKALISELEYGPESESEEAKKKILETSLQSGVVSSLTAYVAVNKDTNTRVEGIAAVRSVPPPNLMQSYYNTPVVYSRGRPGVCYCQPPIVPPALIRLISLQNADGSWDPSAQLRRILDIPKRFTDKFPNLDPLVFTTVVTVIWLDIYCNRFREDWELLVEKSITWVKSQAGSTLEEYTRAAKKLLNITSDSHVFEMADSRSEM